MTKPTKQKPGPAPYPPELQTVQIRIQQRAYDHVTALVDKYGGSIVERVSKAIMGVKR